MKNIYLRTFLVLSLIFVALPLILSCSKPDEKDKSLTVSEKELELEREKELEKEKEKKREKKKEKRKKRKKAKFDIIPLMPGVSVTNNSEGFETINITLSSFNGIIAAKNQIYKDFMGKDSLKPAFAVKIKNTTGGIVRAEPAKEKVYTEFSDFQSPTAICNDKYNLCPETREWEIEHTPTSGSVKLRTTPVLTTSFIWITEGFDTITVDNHQYTPALVCDSSLLDQPKMVADGIDSVELVMPLPTITFRGGESLTCKIGFWSDKANAQEIPQKWIETAKDNAFFDVYFGGLELGGLVSGLRSLSRLGFSLTEIKDERNNPIFQEDVLQRLAKQKETYPSFLKKARIKLVDKLPNCELPENSIIFEGS